MLGYALALKIGQSHDPVPHREVELDQGTPRDDTPRTLLCTVRLNRQVCRQKLLGHPQ